MTYDPPPLFTPPNDWRTVSVHGQPPPNTLIDYMHDCEHWVRTCLTGGGTAAFPGGFRWRLSDLPPLTSTQPPPEPELPVSPIGGWFDPGRHAQAHLAALATPENRAALVGWLIAEGIAVPTGEHPTGAAHPTHLPLFLLDGAP